MCYHYTGILKRVQMKVAVTADVHYGVGHNQHVKQQLLIDCLRLFDAFGGDKLFVAGNHDLWTKGSDSLVLYEKILPKIVNKCVKYQNKNYSKESFTSRSKTTMTAAANKT